MARRRTADKPWQLIIWIIIISFMFFGNIYMMFTEEFDWFSLVIAAALGYALISCIIARTKSFKR